jgi:hypothetical protein
MGLDKEALNLYYVPILSSRNPHKSYGFRQLWTLLKNKELF